MYVDVYSYREIHRGMIMYALRICVSVYMYTYMYVDVYMNMCIYYGRKLLVAIEKYIEVWLYIY
jgi:hypothetical protein